MSIQISSVHICQLCQRPAVGSGGGILGKEAFRPSKGAAADERVFSAVEGVKCVFFSYLFQRRDGPGSDLFVAAGPNLGPPGNIVV